MRHTENPKLSLKKKIRTITQTDRLGVLCSNVNGAKKKNVRVSVSDKDLSEML